MSPKPKLGNPLNRSDIDPRTEERFKESIGVVRPDTACWEWAGVTQEPGYGKIHVARLGRGEFAHRVSFVLHKGPIPAGFTIDHLCMNKRCVNPNHLELVSRSENARRYFAKLTTCKHGHPWDEENTARDWRGRRSCRACNRIRAKRDYWRAKEHARA